MLFDRYLPLPYQRYTFDYLWRTKFYDDERMEITYGGFIKGILRGVRCTKSLRVLFLNRRPPSWTTLVLYSRAVFIFNEPAYTFILQVDCISRHIPPPPPPRRNTSSFAFIEKSFGDIPTFVWKFM
jgi:hypothetical protein